MNKYKYTENMTWDNATFKVLTFITLLFSSSTLLFGIVYLCRNYAWYRFTFIPILLLVLIPMIVEEIKIHREE